MKEIKYKNSEIVLDESIADQLHTVEENCTISVSCESKFKGTPQELAIFTCEKLSKMTGLEVLYNIVNDSSTETSDSIYTNKVTFQAKISQQNNN